MFGKLFKSQPPREHFPLRHAGDAIAIIANGAEKGMVAGRRLGHLAFFQLYTEPPRRTPRSQAGLLIYGGGNVLLYLSSAVIALTQVPLALSLNNEQQEAFDQEGIIEEILRTSKIGWFDVTTSGDVQTAQWLVLTQTMAEMGLVRAEKFGPSAVVMLVYEMDKTLAAVLLFTGGQHTNESLCLLLSTDTFASGVHLISIHEQQRAAYSELIQTATKWREYIQ